MCVCIHTCVCMCVLAGGELVSRQGLFPLSLFYYTSPHPMLPQAASRPVGFLPASVLCPLLVSVAAWGSAALMPWPLVLLSHSPREPQRPSDVTIRLKPHHMAGPCLPPLSDSWNSGAHGAREQFMATLGALTWHFIGFPANGLLSL